jgi:hypothetical protein
MKFLKMRRKKTKRRIRRKIRRMMKKKRTKRRIRIQNLTRRVMMLIATTHMVKDGRRMVNPFLAKKLMPITWMISCVLINIKSSIEENLEETLTEVNAQAEDADTLQIKSKKTNMVNTSMTTLITTIEAERILKKLLMVTEEVAMTNQEGLMTTHPKDIQGEQMTLHLVITKILTMMITLAIFLI